MKKKLALFLDGTWNEPGDNTNGGGIGGFGLSRNVRAAYQWLVEQYDEGDEVYIFGFSRGAYTARSVAGLIVKCGLLRPGAPLTTAQVYERYQLGKEVPSIWELAAIRRTRDRELTADEKRLLTHSRRIPIRMIGVWDTVGALGVPWTQAPLVGRGQFYFHNTNLSVLYEHAFHAIAIDEHRSPYRATLWTQYTPEGRQPKQLPLREKVEQRWFIGAHCNVGGGYRDDDLAQIPLAWLQGKARSCGLAFRNEVRLTGEERLCDLRDSYAEFLKGAWRMLKLGKRFCRQIGADRRGARRNVGDGERSDRCQRFPALPECRAVQAREPRDVGQAQGRRSAFGCRRSGRCGADGRAATRRGCRRGRVIRAPCRWRTAHPQGVRQPVRTGSPPQRTTDAARSGE